jgi:hypothetical protein
MTTERIPLTQPIESRTGSFVKDSRSVNCVFETRDQKREFIKRPGLVAATQITAVTPPAKLQSQGLFSFNSKVISVIDNTIYSTHPSTYVTTTVGSMTSTTSQSYFTRTFLDSYLFFHNKTTAYLYSNGGVLTTIVNDKIVSISIDNPGTGYSSGITLTFSSGAAAATPTVNVTGNITDVAVTNQGSGYAVAPTITIVKPSTVTPTGTGTVGFTTIVVSSATGIYTGMSVTGTGVAPSARVINKAGTTITVDLAHSGAVSGTMTFSDTGSNGVLTASLNSFPTGAYVSGVVSLDSYLFIGVAASNRIYNSAVGDPTSWGALDYITFEQTADTLVAITKHLNYLVAFGNTSTQFFYDNANAVGSPLALSQSYTSEVGCASGDSIVSTDNTVIWVGTSKIYGRSVFLMDGVTPVKVSTVAIDKHLEADTLGQISAYCHKFGGHTLYILTLHGSNVTLVFDINEKMWYQWTQYSMMSSDQSNPGVWMESYFRPTFYADVLGTPFALDDDTATLYYFDVDTYQDAGQDIYCRTVTDIMDNGTTKRKFYGRLELIGDKVVGGIMQVRHSGDDYTTWSSYRSIDLGASRSQVYLSGSDRRRSWEFLCTSNVPLRLDGAEIDFRIGEMDQEQGVGGGRYRR